MRVNILQHTPNEGPGTIKTWAQAHNHEVYTYHPYQFDKLPTAAETDLLIILGGPMSPNDDLDWIIAERLLIKTLMTQNKPIFGACFGAQQIVKSLGYQITKGPKEVGWAPVYLQSDKITGLPKQLMALHWHEETFEIPEGADLLFSSDLLVNQGFVIGQRIIGLQFHFEPQADDVREIVVNDGAYTKDNLLQQTPAMILKTPVPKENQQVMFQLLDYITKTMG